NSFRPFTAYHYRELTSGLLAGLNNTITTLKRQSYGFRNQEYSKLKILAYFNAFLNSSSDAHVTASSVSESNTTRSPIANTRSETACGTRPNRVVKNFTTPRASPRASPSTIPSVFPSVLICS
ncbi:MAG TPA: hypothetical protein DEB39_05900, partial [Planctomycetaceae bacterium]|nr:hypothetical protein [Planctomycetaceae bacterium]